MISVDDKAKVDLGIAAAQKEQKMLMQCERTVKLPDHSYSIAPKHKLIQSVKLICNIDDKFGFGNYRAVRSHGKCYVAVRSNYHTTTSAKTHHVDSLRMLEMNEFSTDLLERNGKMKPVFLTHNDGGSDLQIRITKI